VIPKDFCLFSSMVEKAAIGMIIKDTSGNSVYANPTFTSMLGYGPDEAVDLSLEALVHPEDLPAVRDRLVWMRDGQFHPFRDERRYRHKNGSYLWVNVHAFPLRWDASGRLTHYLIQIVDIGNQKSVEAALAENERRTNFALASAGQWVWDLDIPRKKVWRSSQWKTALGYREDELSDDPEPWRIVHPDDRPAVDAAFQQVMTGQSEVFHATYRLAHKDGRWLWILGRGRVVERDSAGVPLRLLATSVDITEQKRVEEDLAAKSRGE
jgi:PAS domain S-box-containing protein